MRILIIEDEITLNRTLQEGLIDFGYQVDTAENYKDAEYFIDIRNYDLVLTDWMLPDGDGIELCKIVKNRSSRTAVVIISARDDKESEIEALKSGADDFIKKYPEQAYLVRKFIGSLNKIRLQITAIHGVIDIITATKLAGNKASAAKKKILYIPIESL